MHQKPVKPLTVSPRSTKSGVSPVRSQQLRDQPLKQQNKRQHTFKIQQQPQAATAKFELSRLHTLGDQITAGFDDDYETPKFNIEKQFKFGAEERPKKQGDFFSFGLSKKQPLVGSIQSKSKGKENSNSYLTGKETTKNSNQTTKVGSRNIPVASGKIGFRKETGRDSVSPRKKFG